MVLRSYMVKFDSSHRWSGIALLLLRNRVVQTPDDASKRQPAAGAACFPLCSAACWDTDR